MDRRTLLLIPVLAATTLRAAPAVQPREVELRNLLKDRKSLSGKRISIRGTLYSSMEVIAIVGDGCTEPRNDFGKHWVCGALLSPAAKAGREVRELLRYQPERGAEKGKTVVVTGTVYTSPMWRLPEGKMVEIGIGHLNAYAVAIEVESVSLK